jgi:hypothetical protein
MVAAEQAGEMEGIIPALYQPPSSATVPQTLTLPAFNVVFLSSTCTQTRLRVAIIMTALPWSPSSALQMYN